jgi:hypothetical protein
VIRSRNIVVAAIAAILLFNCVALLATNSYVASRANAAERFTPETVKSVPPSFLKGGARTVTALGRINATLRENGQKLDRIAEELEKLNTNMTRVLRENK